MKYHKTPRRMTPATAFKLVERAILEGLAKREFRQDEKKAVLAFFGNDPPECVYCGSNALERWDHLVPVTSGGELVLGNVVPCCGSCDDSKAQRHWKDWITSSAPKSPITRGVKDIDRRAQRIMEYVQHFGYKPRTLEERLDGHELQQLHGIRETLGRAQKDIETLIEGYHMRNRAKRP